MPRDWKEPDGDARVVAVGVVEKGARSIKLSTLSILHCAYNGDAPAGHALDISLLPDCILHGPNQ